MKFSKIPRPFIWVFIILFIVGLATTKHFTAVKLENTIDDDNDDKDNNDKKQNKEGYETLKTPQDIQNPIPTTTDIYGITTQHLPADYYRTGASTMSRIPAGYFREKGEQNIVPIQFNGHLITQQEIQQPPIQKYDSNNYDLTYHDVQKQDDLYSSQVDYVKVRDRNGNLISLPRSPAQNSPLYYDPAVQKVYGGTGFVPSYYESILLTHT